MSSRSLIVARMRPGSQSEVARLFAESDGTRLPDDLGVTRRHLFSYHGLYFHYVEFEGDADEALRRARQRTDFAELASHLSAHIEPYDPSTWSSPADALADEFYCYRRNGGAA